MAKGKINIEKLQEDSIIRNKYGYDRRQYENRKYNREREDNKPTKLNYDPKKMLEFIKMKMAS